MAAHLQNIMHGMMGAVNPDDHQTSVQTKPGPSITISRAMGCEGDDIGEMVAKRLNIHCYGREILDEVAKKAKVTPDLMSKLIEQVKGSSDAWLYSLFSGKNIREDDYLESLVTTIRWLYSQGGVILGRGGNIILAGRDVLRIRITASETWRAETVAKQDGISREEALNKVRESNETRTRFMEKLFHSNYRDVDHFDLVINRDSFPDKEAVVDLIIYAVKVMGLDKR